jgi:two-component system nitrate/nitrite response regulator NarL
MDVVMHDKPVKVLLLDNQGLFRSSLHHFLAAQPGIQVQGECGNADEAFRILDAAPVDMTVLNLDLGVEHGNDFITAARERGYAGRFLIVSNDADVYGSAQALYIGASGVLLKSTPPEHLLQAIERISEGELWVDAAVVQMMAAQITGHFGH